MELTERIRQYLSKSPHGLSARDIASFLGTTRYAVNSCLYQHSELFVRDNSYIPQWTVRDLPTLSDPVLQKLQNHDGAKVFTKEEFDDIADWEVGVAFVGNYLFFSDCGNIIQCDSKSEVILLEYLENNKLVRAVGGQMLCISYDTAFRSQMSYYPDIVAYTRDGHIAVFEVKPVTAMDNHTNIEKYHALAQYCKERGYLYAMIDPSEEFMTFEEVRNMPICTAFLGEYADFFEERWSDEVPYKCFDEDDVALWYELYGGAFSKKDFFLQVHSMVIFYGWYNFYKNGFKVFSRPVMLNSNHEVIDYI